ncbi:MAG: hypothetical protein Kow0069_06950 [Promethearchaeota archaeon]
MSVDLDGVRRAVLKRRHSILGYGTFLTRGEWKGAEGVEPAFLSGYRRVLPPGNPFPFAIRDPDCPGFWALKFEVTPLRLVELDHYEGIKEGLYHRRKLPARLVGGDRWAFVYVYLPTAATVRRFKLSPSLDPDDSWKEVLRADAELVARFPQLVE